MLFMAAAARHLLPLDRSMHGGLWAPQGGVELAGRTVAIIGSGRIGAATARIASAGFGMRVIGCRRSAVPGTPPPAGFEAVMNDYGAAVADADYVVLLLPGSPENTRFINRERLALLPERAWLINTARGTVVDEVALYDALQARRIAGLATDVFAQEPYVPADPARDLRTLDNVILVPHIGSNTTAANERMSARAVRNVLLGADSRFEGMDLLNPEVLSGT
jgi:phosphoglycerate dehydrogenase-like enzyme